MNNRPIGFFDSGLGGLTCIPHLMEALPEEKIFSAACPAFVPLIEEGIIENDIMNLTIKYYLDDFIKNNNIDTLVLGCTHYPLIRKNIEKIYPNLKIIDPSEIVVSTIVEQLESKNLIADVPNYENVFCASDLSENFMNMIDRIFENSEVKVKFKSFDIEEPEEFKFYENFADLIEYEGEIPYDTLFPLIKKVDMVTLGEFIETYMDDVLEGIPEEDGIDAYTFITSVKMMLLGLAESIATAEEDEERDELPIFVEELYKFRNWFTRDSIIHMSKENDKTIISVPLLEAIISYRIEKLNEEHYSYNFDDCVPYEIDEYIVSYSSAMVEVEDEEEDTDSYLEEPEDSEA